MELTDTFVVERPRLLGMATRILDDASEAEDVLQQAWMRLDRHDGDIENLPGWLTTVTVRLCLDSLRRRTPEPRADFELPEVVADPADDVELVDTVGAALQVVLDRLTPAERVAFVLHDSFSFDFASIATVLDTSPAAARKLASRARGKVKQPADGPPPADREVVDAFLAAAREGEFAQLLRLLAPDAVVRADEAAISAGTPARVDGRYEVATFFNGAARAALPVHLGGRPGAAWYHRGEPRVIFDFTVVDGLVHRIDFRADPEALAQVSRRSRDPRD